MAKAIDKYDKAWSRYFRYAFQDMDCPEPLAMMAIKNAFLSGYKAARQDATAAYIARTFAVKEPKAKAERE